MTQDLPAHASYFTSADRNYLAALWRQYDAQDPNDALTRREYSILIEMHVIACVLKCTHRDLAELRRLANEPPKPPDSRRRPISAGGGIIPKP